MTDENDFQGISDFLRIEAAGLTDPTCMEAAKCLREWAKSVDSVQAARAAPADPRFGAVADVAEDLQAALENMIGLYGDECDNHVKEVLQRTTLAYTKALLGAPKRDGND